MGNAVRDRDAAAASAHGPFCLGESLKAGSATALLPASSRLLTRHLPVRQTPALQRPLRLPAEGKRMNTSHPCAAARDTAAPAVPEPPRIHLVDDEESVRKALGRLLASHGFAVQAHAGAEAFLAGHDPEVHGCVLLDLAMPGLDGLALQDRMTRDGECLPVIFLTGRADVPLCASAMRGGAVDFLTKPVDEALLLAAIQRALRRDKLRRQAWARRAATEARLAMLTPRERQVLIEVMKGRLNKQIAGDLGTTEKTVKVHRARAMEKMCVRSVAEVVRMVERAQTGLDPFV
jgi:FixJ family two-component response regulator